MSHGADVATVAHNIMVNQCAVAFAASNDDKDLAWWCATAYLESSIDPSNDAVNHAGRNGYTALEMATLPGQNGEPASASQQRFLTALLQRKPLIFKVNPSLQDKCAEQIAALCMQNDEIRAQIRRLISSTPEPTGLLKDVEQLLPILPDSMDVDPYNADTEDEGTSAAFVDRCLIPRRRHNLKLMSLH